MVLEVIEWLQVGPGKRYIDATAGGGGHTEEIVRRRGEVLAIDQDSDAVGELRRRFVGENGVTICQGNFGDIVGIARNKGFIDVDGILFDLGVSSYQLDTPNRGFSYRYLDAPLDMRMNDSTRERASDIVNSRSENELYEIIARFGEEELALPIAHAIVGARTIKKITTVGDIVFVVRSVAKNKTMASNTLGRVFQALRIAVNDEIDALHLALEGTKTLLRPGGRLAVISFHSLEDRKVKRFMATDRWNRITKKFLVPSGEEIVRNSRSKSAKLRVAEKYE